MSFADDLRKYDRQKEAQKKQIMMHKIKQRN